MYRLQTPQRQFARVVLWPGVFSRYDCDWIDRLAAQVPVAPALVGEEHAERHETRKSELRWLQPEGAWLWLYQRLNLVINEVNARHFGYALTDIQDVQHTTYHAPGGHYTWHQDAGGGAFAGRKLSLSVVLTDPALCEGGIFELFQHGPVIAGQGDAIVFPSHEHHRVTPVTSGVRKSLVAWVQGPDLR